MRVTVTEADFRPAYDAVKPRPPESMTLEEYQETDEHSELWRTSHVRMAAENGVLSLKSHWGQASCKAEVEEPGVLFLTMREWQGLMKPVRYMDDPHTIVATDDYFHNEWGRTQASYHGENFVYFPDPARAPQTYAEIEWEEVPEEDALTE